MDNLKRLIYSLPQFARLKAIMGDPGPLHMDGIYGSFRAFICAYFFEEMRKPLLYIANDMDSAEQLRDDMELLLGRNAVAFLPSLGQEPYDFSEPNPSLVSLRLEAMQKFIADDRWVAVTYPQGLMQALPDPEQFVDNQIYLRVGQQIDFEKLQRQLQGIGFERTEVVEKVGDYCIRGGIIDVFPWNDEDPYRIELFGNQVESLRKFDVLSQRSITAMSELTILANLKDHRKGTFIHQLIPAGTLTFYEDRQLTRQRVAENYQKALDHFTNNHAFDMDIPAPEIFYMNAGQLDVFLRSFPCLMSNLVREEGTTQLPFNVKPHPDFNGSIKNFLAYLKKRSQSRPVPQIIIQAINRDQSQRLQEIIDEEELPFHGKFLTGTLHSGFILPDLALEILTDHQVFSRFKRRKAYRRFKSGEYLRQLKNLNHGDYVVHIDYGIGQYLGMETIVYGDVKKECIKIAYQDGDHLFVTVDRMNRVQKYSSEESVAPKITRLGSPEWERTKKKTKESLKKIADELIRIYAGRKAQGGHQFSPDSHWQKELEASFIYEETEDQLRSIQNVKEDMEKEKPMDRLLCGDVGFGKTEVALRAAFKAVMDGKQVAVLVPTTILAFQHFSTFRERLNELPVNVEMINRFRTVSEQKKILLALAEGKIDIIIATHRLLSGDVRFKDLGLVIVDEEQRFGVKQKEQFKKYRLSVDFLSMTATPIPRTLHMALMGTRDLSHIDTPPRNRLPVHTEIAHWNDNRLYDIINHELERRGQVYFVHNRLETIEAVRDMLQSIIPHARIVVGHGQLPDRKLEKVMLDFMAQRYDVLVASMIIENGLDIPNVNTIIINRADKFGLAQLYQLRGRVGRSDQQAYAYLLVPPLEKLTEIARKRLRAIQDFTDLGSGYKVALRDLEIRGAGNLLGKEQSGFVQSVGFELYCKLLDEAVKELKQGLTDDKSDEKFTAPIRKYTDPKLDVNFDLLIPADYIANELERITIYHRLVNFTSIEQVEQLRLELDDRFGKIPQAVENFFQAIEIKILTGRMYAQRIILKDQHLKIYFDDTAQDDDDFFKAMIPNLMNQKLTTVKFINQKNLGVEIALQGDSHPDKISFAKKFLQQVITNN